MNRRTYLSIAGASVTAVLSGCGRNSSSDDGSGSNISGSEQPPEQDNRDTGVEHNTSENTQTARNSSDDAEPNSPPEFELIELEIPAEITQPDTINVKLTVENTSDTPGKYRGEIDIDADGVFLPTGIRYDKEINAGERVTLTETLNPTRSGFVTFSIEGIKQEVMVIPERTEPQIQGVKLVREWNEYGDVYQNAIDSALVGRPTVIAVRYWYWHGDAGTVDIAVEYTTQGDGISRPDVAHDRSKRLVRQRGWEPREEYIEILTYRWDPGEYTTEVQMRDGRNGGLSATEQVTYTLE